MLENLGVIEPKYDEQVGRIELVINTGMYSRHVSDHGKRNKKVRCV